VVARKQQLRQRVATVPHWNLTAEALRDAGLLARSSPRSLPSLRDACACKLVLTFSIIPVDCLRWMRICGACAANQQAGRLILMQLKGTPKRSASFAGRWDAGW